MGSGQEALGDGHASGTVNATWSYRPKKGSTQGEASYHTEPLPMDLHFAIVTWHVRIVTLLNSSGDLRLEPS